MELKKFIKNRSEYLKEELNANSDGIIAYHRSSKKFYKFDISNNGWLFYKTISRILGSDKYTSTFLFNNGVDGLKSNIAKNFNDYILFSDNDITIEGVKYDPN